MHRRRRTQHLGILAALVLATPSAVAAGVKNDADAVAIIAVDITGDADPELRQHVEGAIERGLERAGSHPLSLTAVRAAIGKQHDLLGCTSTGCLERIAKKTGAPRFVTVRISASGASYELAIELLRADIDDAVESRLRGTCAVCSIAELEERVDNLAHAVVTLGPETPRAIEVASDPPGASLVVGESLSGTAPLAGQIAPGEYRVEATLEGHVAAELTITVTTETDEVQRYSITLTPDATKPPPDPPPDPPPPPEPFRYGWMKWAAVGGAVVGLAAGFALIAMDGDQACTPEVEGAQCEQVYTTGGLGIGTAVLGVALAGTGVWMILHDRKVDRARERDHRVGITPARGGGAIASYALRF